MSNQCFVSLKTGKSFSLCSLSKYSAKYFCPMNHKPVNPVSSAAINISPRGDEYLFVYCIACIFPWNSCICILQERCLFTSNYFGLFPSTLFWFWKERLNALVFDVLRCFVFTVLRPVYKLNAFIVFDWSVNIRRIVLFGFVESYG